MSLNLASTIAFFRSHPGYLKWGTQKLAEKLGVSKQVVRMARHDLLTETIMANDSQSVTKGGSPPKDKKTNRNLYAEFLKDRGIDEDDVVSVKHWQSPGGEARFSVVTRDDQVIGDEEIIDALKGILRDSVVVRRVPTPKVVCDNIVVFNMFDAHIDKISLASEIYEATNFSLDESFANLERKFDEVVDGLPRFHPEEILFPVGSDFWTTNGVMGTTARGTPQRTLAPHEEVFTRGVRFYRDCIDKLQAVGKTVKVITIKGNHDPQPVFYLGVALDVAYEKNPRVEVHSTRRNRKYFEFGEWGFGFGHGADEKRNMDRMPLWFAQEAKDIWYRTERHEFFLGDIHHKEEYKFKRAYDGVGMTAYFLRSCNGVDMWHCDSGWVGIPKTIEAFIYEKNSGSKNVISVSW